MPMSIAILKKRLALAAGCALALAAGGRAANAGVSDFDGYQDESATQITLQGWRNGAAVGAPVTVNLDPAAYHMVAANFPNVDTVTFSASGGIDPDGASFYLLDDFTFTEVPEPTSLSL